MSRASVLVTGSILAAVAGCAWLGGPCGVADAPCLAAADFAELRMGSDDWRAVIADDIDCAEFAANRAGIDPERCWRVELESTSDAEDRRETDVILTAEGDFVRFGESRPLDE